MTPERIRAVREALGLTQQALADKVGVKIRTVQRWLAGDHPPSGAALKSLLQLEIEADPALTRPPFVGRIGKRRPRGAPHLSPEDRPMAASKKAATQASKAPQGATKATTKAAPAKSPPMKAKGKSC